MRYKLHLLAIDGILSLAYTGGLIQAFGLFARWSPQWWNPHRLFPEWLVPSIYLFQDFLLILPFAVLLVFLVRLVDKRWVWVRVIGVTLLPLAISIVGMLRHHEMSQQWPTPYRVVAFTLTVTIPLLVLFWQRGFRRSRR